MVGKNTVDPGSSANGNAHAGEGSNQNTQQVGKHQRANGSNGARGSNGFAPVTINSDNTSKLQPASPAGASQNGADMSELSQAAAELQAFKTLKTKTSNKKRSKIIRFVIAGVVLVAAALVGVFVVVPLVNPPQIEYEAPTAEITRGTYVDTVRGTGRITPVEQVTIMPEIEGTITEVLVSEGEMVTQNQTLFTVDNSDLDVAVTASERGLESSNMAYNASVRALTNAREAADTAYQKYKDFWYSVKDGSYYLNNQKVNPDGSIDPADDPEEKLEELYQAYRTAEEAALQAQDSVRNGAIDVEKAQTDVDKAVVQADKRTVVSPISGQVVSNSLERGMRLTAASTDKAPMQIADMSKVIITLSINELDILKFKVGQQATVTIGALENYTVDAVVTRVSNASAAGATPSNDSGGPAGGGVVTFPVDILIENPDPRVKVGMSASVEVSLETIDDVLMVNAGALIDMDGKTYVSMQDDEGNVSNVEVEVISRNTSTAAIKGAVKEGDVVLIVIATDPSTDSLS